MTRGVTALHRATPTLAVLERFPARCSCRDRLEHTSLLATMPQDVNVVAHVASGLNYETAENATQTAISVAGTRRLVAAALARNELSRRSRSLAKMIADSDT